MPAVGTVWKRDTRQVWMYSKTKVWRPFEPRGIDPATMQVGHRYEVDFETKEIVSTRGPNQYHEENLRAHGLVPGGAQDAPARPVASAQHASPEIPLNSLIASATGVVKSMLEREALPSVSFQAGLEWAEAWAELPERAKRSLRELAQHTGTEAKQEAEVDDDVPF